MNVSGLLWRDDAAPKALHMRLDYARVCRQLVEGLVAAGADVLLVPHVRDVAHGRESDLAAAQALRAALHPAAAARVFIAPDELDADEVKWVIARLDWFSGARMHATIAALSSGVAASAVGYSMKTRAVFATCGVADQVVDAATTDTEEAVQRLLHGFTRRHEVQDTLVRRLPDVVAKAHGQLIDVLGHVTAAARRSWASAP